MKVYLVGGAVRDALLGLPVRERDWVVVGASPEQLAAQGFTPVGRDFPVFLHPTTHEEYALARQERKIGPGYRGFETRFSPDVSLEDDLSRRDLTINAIAQDDAGQLLDPHHGQRDLGARLLRHVSPAFVEDPVRILRVARFAARFAPLGFTVAEETRALMQAMVAAGEASALVPERVWKEMERALGELRPDVFLHTLQECGALAVVLPELAVNDLGLALPSMRTAAAAGFDGAVVFAAMVRSAGLDAERELGPLCARLRVPNPYRELAVLALRRADRLRAAAAQGAAELLQTLEQCDAFRRPERFAQLLDTCQCLDAATEPALGWAQTRARLEQALRAAQATTLSPDQLAKLRGAEIGAALQLARAAAIEAAIDKLK